MASSDDAPREGIPSWAHVMPELHPVFVEPPLATLVTDTPDMRFRVYCYYLDSLRQWVVHVAREDGTFARRVAIVDPPGPTSLATHPPEAFNTHALMLHQSLKPRMVRLDAPAAKLTDRQGHLLFHFCLSSDVQQRWISARLVFCPRNQPPPYLPGHAGHLDPVNWHAIVNAPDTRSTRADSAAQQLVRELAEQASREADTAPRAERRSPSSGAERGSSARQRHRDERNLFVRLPQQSDGRDRFIYVNHAAPHALGYTTVRERVRVMQGESAHLDIVTEHRFPRASEVAAGTAPLRLVSARIFHASTEPAAPETPPNSEAERAASDASDAAAAGSPAPAISVVRSNDALVEIEDLMLVRRLEGADLERESVRARLRERMVRVLEARLAAWRDENAGDASTFTAHTRMLALVEQARRSSCSLEHLRSLERGYCAVLETYERERLTQQAPSMLDWSRR